MKRHRHKATPASHRQESQQEELAFTNTQADAGGSPALLWTDLDRHFAALIERLAGGSQPAVALAAALVSARRREGHICLELNSVAGTTFSELAPRAATRNCPPLAEWTALLRASRVVGRPGEFKPLVLDDAGRLYLHRYWEYESRLADTLKRRASQAVAQTSKSAVSPTSKSAELAEILRPADVEAPAGLETRDTADLEVCATGALSECLDRLFARASSTEVDWQRSAAETAVRRQLCVISGGPGTGKTRTLVRILALLIELAGEKPLRFALAAPTGKAAARIQEELRRAKEALPCSAAVKARLPEEAMTLHRLLEARPDSAMFRRNAENPFAADVVVVDEASMIDLALMAKLFDAVRPAAKVILLGDKDQLASVEAGAVLGDICAGAVEKSEIGPGFVPPHPGPLPVGEGETTPALGEERWPNTQAATEPDASLSSRERAGVRGNESSHDQSNSHAAPTAPAGKRNPLAECIVELRKNFRFGHDSAIGRLSGAVNAGDADAAVAILRDGQPAKGEVIWTPLPDAGELKAALKERLLAGFGAYLEADDPRAAIEALSRFRILCAVRAGPRGVERINALAEEILESAGRLQRNGPWYLHRPVMVTRNDYKLRLFNGDVGAILRDPDSGEPRAFFLSAESELRSFPPARLPAHETVFAMTVHKSQGSEFERVLLILPERDSPVLTRELLYTGLTRARKQVEVWAGEAVLRQAVAKRMERSSGLRDALWGGNGG